ncbi:MAG TPA: bifunctional diaminohydroxyphosphoribosylaminopyrimidine deaminase/5-amino-6-(5-phosphoribosylamino)uracil reductase RibD [Deltaproteobacteria bacterium]|nr:bifunctional diaminohydroxyphosphoribosylaminopyrimidine deaminase/5-amino-6-(5-phosphoribosylamino)uracil reductase RibD [Deltaproteobacteria bacterium]HPR54583.1 bifunctional diaminohydroxyphosphoribosylaminopyrimidine deaminase/5-amino-6-(5-phosphoribosylamino)uracil reductase RibD [Deltaproteobacteria bacterium]HXK48013.1 bifunctional diaminohydroxyphosphoribosylaminopyrimidine deaminase/5-amino-6-(5-phosphoribosylamino)uracil reductase RibD [Deltaproteobacteria bacterium]
MQTNPDITFMNEAIALARQAIGRTAPNPSVGAVIVKDGQVVGRGFHPKAGMPHAEVYALREAGEEARGAALYVTLEPCDHHGRTPPCTESVIRAGISRVIVGTLDPNPLVAGKGIERLKTAGITVDTGVCEEVCRDLILWYGTWMEKKRPYVILKAAVTLDGRIAAATGDSQWISSEVSRAFVHELRNRVDGVMVGSGTVVSDDPLLTCRMEGGRDPVRIILDPRLEVPHTARSLGKGAVVFTIRREDDRPGPVESGVQVIRMEPDASGMIPWDAVFGTLGGMGLHAVMVEGGSGVYSSLLKSGLVDRLLIFIAPKILGGGIPLVDWGKPERIADALRFVISRTDILGGDILVEGRLED